MASGGVADFAARFPCGLIGCMHIGYLALGGDEQFTHMDVIYILR
jgi:hypothetical protein